MPQRLNGLTCSVSRRKVWMEGCVWDSMHRGLPLCDRGLCCMSRAFTWSRSDLHNYTIIPAVRCIKLWQMKKPPFVLCNIKLRCCCSLQYSCPNKVQNWMNTPYVCQASFTGSHFTLSPVWHKGDMCMWLSNKKKEKVMRFHLDVSIHVCQRLWYPFSWIHFLCI